jgi:hypothetical protein
MSVQLKLRSAPRSCLQGFATATTGAHSGNGRVCGLIIGGPARLDVVLLALVDFSEYFSQDQFQRIWLRILDCLARPLRLDLAVALVSISGLERNHLDGLTNELATLTQSNGKKLEVVLSAIETRHSLIGDDNAKDLDQMRATADERLQGAEEERLGDSFKQVCERLEQAHQGLGEMQALASGVGDLERVLTNLNTRGTWGAIQMETLLEQILSAEGVARDVSRMKRTTRLSSSPSRGLAAMMMARRRCGFPWTPSFLPTTTGA